MEIDHEIEIFWINLKISMMNFYNQSSIIVSRPIDNWSNYLNQLQKENKYTNIEESIIKYISLYAIDLMRAHDTYNINILHTNIKRWDKICLKYKIFDDKNMNKGCNLIFVLFDIYYLLMNKKLLHKELFDDLELFLLFGDFRTLIEYSYFTKSISIIDKLLKYDSSIFNQIKDIYNIDDSVNNSISGRKLFKIIESSKCF